MLLDLLRFLRGHALSVVRIKVRQRTHACRSGASLVLLEREVCVNPTAEKCNELGIVLAERTRFNAALAMFDQAIALSPGFAPAYVSLHTKMRVCDWGYIREDFTRLEAMIERCERATPPFPVLANAELTRGTEESSGGLDPLPL